MTELIRWVDDDATEAEQRLLATARGDGPGQGKREHLLATLGVGSALAAGAAVGLAGASSAAAVATAAGTPAGKAIGAGVGSVGGAVIGTGAVGASAPLIGIVKWIGIGLVAGAVTSGSLSAVMSGTKAPEPSDVATSPQPMTERPMRPEARLSERPAAPAEPPVSAKPPAPSSASFGSAEPEAPPTDVAQEVATLDSAREALRSGDARRALKTLAEHQQRFAGGELGPEAELLRIEALIESGQRSVAASRARTFLTKNGSSPHAPRVRSLLGRIAAASEGSKAAPAPRSTPLADPPAPHSASPSASPAEGGRPQTRPLASPPEARRPQPGTSAPSTASFPAQ